MKNTPPVRFSKTTPPGFSKRDFKQFLKIHLAQINPIVGDLSGNYQKILAEIKKAAGGDLVVFPEMVITGYPAEDLWLKKGFIDATAKMISELVKVSKAYKCAILVGAPQFKKNFLYNSAFLIESGKIKQVFHKRNLPNGSVFDEQRYFESGVGAAIIKFRGYSLLVSICEDFWHIDQLSRLGKVDAVIAINASPYYTDKQKLRIKNARTYVRKFKAPVIYLNQVGGHDSLVFDGASFVLDQKSKITQFAQFATDSKQIELRKTNSKIEVATDHTAAQFTTEEADYSALVLGVRDYVVKSGFSEVLLGMSGGIDSALVAAIAVDALGPKNVHLYALPTRYNSPDSLRDAKQCAKKLSLNLEIIEIEPTFKVMIETLKLENESDPACAITRENLQARIRGNILMALANRFKRLLLATSNKSEASVGYATLYGDMCGAYSPIKDVYKTRIYEIAKWRNQNLPKISLYSKIDLIPNSILTKAPTAELRPNQKDSDSLPDYGVLDKILFQLIEQRKSVAEVVKMGYQKEIVEKVAKLLQLSEYKRKQSALGPKISTEALDKDRRYPIINYFRG